MAAIDRDQQPTEITLSEDALRRMVGQDKHRPGRARGRLVAEQIPVWAIIGYVGALVGTTEPTAITDAVIAQTAEDYDVSIGAVKAALLYYRENRCVIDDLLEVNAAALA